MTRAGWFALILAIAFPSVALVVVLLARPSAPIVVSDPAGAGLPFGPEPLPMPPSKMGKRPHPFPEETLVSLRKELALTDEQVEAMRKIAEPARARLGELEDELWAKERELREILRRDDPDVDDITQRMGQVSELRAERDRIIVVTPVKLRQVLTAEQRERVIDVWRNRPQFLGKGPPGHHLKRPPLGKAPPPGFPGGDGLPPP